VFGQEAVEHFSTEFSWLGKLTGPPRDLDVLIVTLHERRREASFQGLHALVTLLERMRREEHTRLVDGLNSDRFKRLTSQWKAFLEQPISAQPPGQNARRPLADVVFERAWRLSRKISRGAALLDASTAAEIVHDLRVQAKKLRYLVDVAPASRDDLDVKRVLAALKALQRVLGDFNDAHVQEHRLIECRGVMAATGAGHESLMAIERLAERARVQRELLRRYVLQEAQHFRRKTVRSACRRAFSLAQSEAQA